MALIFLSGLAMASYFLALCYMLMTFMGISKLCSTKTRSFSRTTQLLMVSVSLGCLFRASTFSTLCFLDFQHIESGISPLSSSLRVPVVTPPEETDLSFYNKVVAVLFNLPDYLFVSSYLLVVLLWAETYQSSRRHWFSAEQFHRRWMIFYLIFNALLYMTQVILYALLFLRADPTAIDGIYENAEGTQLAIIPTLIFDCVAAADLFLPLIIFGTWIYLTLTLSGFPYKSQHAQAKLSKVGRLAMAWSLGRILYSVMMLLTFTRGWFNVGKNNMTTQSMLLVALFVAAEILPIYILIDADLLSLLSMDAYEQLVEA
ncbi:unnamed protein product [Aphanomyces euteiches]|uniref:THH1/TOM1/TOM3 domain-containing protein n=1 Tax=Aphanomyces euteiches TaxID=100861 RepID=A0A6G0WAC3_9STRA|nr:hypothetical protein Ae201684_016974 [Aphanomyces euteiches]KAH9073690.1 hypothetical protein Ae201684P_003193 [Aphanomyces euteiches]KAH9158025.1 hypothetical protein AeRB84_000160 [Aphanomyces euteiches]